ncbi:NADPH:quinone oxidoreductase family protein [Planococcus salinus]|uniref:NADPH:quinone oxidoreductase family protein n=1 Tax=Planococcus salinus TaxID=1848460 RepID=A0A3M8PAK7_9BACL|nr:NADPH:quinone oxidoreductase family protein [Planococcus salinus]RNF40224.1 NADPH:quinone oxidoreductase family protein [Planococcus salinus]
MRKWEVVELGEPEKALKLIETSMPTLKQNEVLVKVESTAMNFFDILQCKGEYQEKPDLPFTPGAELSGVVTEPGDSGMEKGQRVIATPNLPEGAFSEYVAVKKEDVFPIPESMTWNEAASMFITYHTSYYALFQCAYLKRGDVLLVHAGSGGVGSAAIQLGKAFGAKVIATAGSDEKVQICKDLGAIEAINYREEDFVQKVKDFTGGKGADVIFDPVGGDTFDRSRKCIAFAGRILIIGFAGGRIADAPTNHLLIKNYSAVGVHFGLFRKLMPDKVVENHQELMKLYEKRDISPLVYSEYEFNQLPEALKQLAQRETYGKLVLRV